MDEKAKKTGPARTFPDAVYRLAYDLFKCQGKTARQTAEAINAKEIGNRIDSSQVPYLAKIGKTIKAANS